MKSLFTYRRSPYYITEISLAIILLSLVVSISLRIYTPLVYASVVVTLLLLINFIIEGMSTIGPLLRKHRYKYAIQHSAPYIAWNIIGIIVIRLLSSFH